ncbi:MAG: ABC transporter ATP-binding protein [Phycisphaerales bacterium]
MSIRDLAVSFRPRAGSGGAVRAVSAVDLSLFARQTVAVVGESGSGKSVTAMSVLGLLDRASAVTERGTIRFAARGGEVDLLRLHERELRAIRGGQIAMIFQEPMTSLNPVYSIGEQIIEAVVLHQRVGRREARERAIAALREVAIAEPERRIDAFPHQFSGGMRQRVMIAMALACNPAVLIADEPTTALDVTVQSQILDLFAELRDRRGMGIVLITHALGVVAEAADVVCVMYAGRVVEYATVFDLFDRPLHPYTRALLACIPSVRTTAERLTTVRMVIDDDAGFQGLGTPPRGRPWWPHHAPPEGTQPHPTMGIDSTLAEVEPGHWVAVWRGAGMADSAPPSIAFTRNAPSQREVASGQ